MSAAVWIAAEAERPAGGVKVPTGRTMEDASDSLQRTRRKTGETLREVEVGSRESLAVSGESLAADLGTSADVLENAAWALYEQ
jgi:hypothetical protein